jgi:FkbM family methyltransferase
MNEDLKGALRQFLPRTLRPHKIMGGQLRGSAIVTSWHDYPAAILGRTERALLDYFKDHVVAGETWLDIGAHYGYTAIALSRLVGPSGRVFAFEPMLNTAGCISRTRVLNRIPQLTVVPMALGNGSDISIESLGSVRGMIDSTLEKAEGFKETFLASKLDWLWPKIAGADLQVHGIKIDVQGMELQVIEGMQSLAAEHLPKLLIEVHKGVSRQRLLDLLASIGYVPRGLPVEPLPGEMDPVYADDRTYAFTPDIH